MNDTAARSGWTRVAFGDVVKLSGERSSSPAEDGFDRFVGLDHIDPGELRIRRWGDLAAGSTFTSVFRPGQVLFGKRRAYQRKVAVADFSGVCSGDIYVLVPRNAHLLPELLPFICQTEGFFEHAVGTSAGSLSPRTNWDSLAGYEFALPPMNDQRRIAGILSGMERLADGYRESTFALAGLTKRFLLAEYQSACADGPMYRIGDVGEMKMGRQKAPKYIEGSNQRRFLRVANVGELELRLEELEQMDFSDDELARFRLFPGDILLTEGDLISRFNVGRPALFRGEIDDCCFQNTLIRFRPNSHLDAEYALLLLEGARLSGVFARAAKTTTVTHLGLGRLAEVSIPVPPLGRQRTAAATLMSLLDMRAALRERLASSATLRAKFLAEALA